MTDGHWRDEDHPRERAVLRAVLQGFGQSCRGARKRAQLLEVARAWREQTAYASYGLTNASDKTSKRKRHTKPPRRVRVAWWEDTC